MLINSTNTLAFCMLNIYFNGNYQVSSSPGTEKNRLLTSSWCPYKHYSLNCRLISSGRPTVALANVAKRNNRYYRGIKFVTSMFLIFVGTHNPNSISFLFP